MRSRLLRCRFAPAESDEIEDQQQHSEGDRDVGEVEDVERPILPVKMKEIRNRAVEHAVDCVRECAADAEHQPDLDQQMACLPPPETQGQEGEDNDGAEDGQRQAAHEAVGYAGVPDEDIIEEVRYSHDLAAAPADGFDLVKLMGPVEQERTH